MIDQRSQLVAVYDYRRIIHEETFVEAEEIIEEEAQPNWALIVAEMKEGLLAKVTVDAD